MKNIHGKNICGISFCGENLNKSNFTEARAGLKLITRFWLGLFGVTSASLSSITAIFSGALIALDYTSLKAYNFGLSEISFLIYVASITPIIIRGFEVFSISIIVSLIVINTFITLVFDQNSGMLSLILLLSLSIAFAWLGIIITAFSLAFTTVIGGVLCEFSALVGASFIATFVTVFNIELQYKYMTLIAVSIVIFASVIIARQSIKGSPNFAWIREKSVFWAAIGGTSFYKADLTDACFDGAHLPYTDFRKANLTRTSFKGVTGLEFSRLEGTILENLKVRKLLVTKRGNNEDYTGAKFNGANLTNADLTGATLSGINALDVDFSEATLSGACIQEWNINKNTRFTGVKCSHVYLKCIKQGDRIILSEGKPDSGEFQDGEFEKWISELQKTIDLIFKEGLNWRAFMFSLAQTAINHEGLDLSRYSITRDQNLVFAKIGLFAGADHRAIHEEFTSCYENAVKLIDSNYQLILQAKDEELERLRELFTSNYQIVRELASVVAGTGRQVLIQGTGNRIYMLNQAGDIMESKNEGINIGGNVGGNLDTGDKISTGGDMNLTGSSLTGNLNNVTNTNQQLSNVKTDSTDDLAKILSILQKSIGDDAALSESQKKEALEAVEIIAEEGKKPQGERALKFCSMAVNALKGLTSTVSDASKLAEVLKTHLPALTSILGL
ncbi:pentapeptide repeat-containing protein [Nostoc sp. FACHB-973]|nr:pentapeptide repeat-containing protein [Nostoc sp. FACHB-973]